MRMKGIFRGVEWEIELKDGVIFLSRKNERYILLQNGEMIKCSEQAKPSEVFFVLEK